MTREVYMACSRQVQQYVSGYFSCLEDQKKYDLRITFEQLSTRKRRDIVAVVEESQTFLKEAKPEYLDFLKMILLAIPPQQSGTNINVYRGVENMSCRRSDDFIEMLQKKVVQQNGLFVFKYCGGER